MGDLKEPWLPILGSLFDFLVGESITVMSMRNHPDNQITAHGK
jgi:hypothetical protein